MSVKFLEACIASGLAMPSSNTVSGKKATFVRTGIIIDSEHNGHNKFLCVCIHVYPLACSSLHCTKLSIAIILKWRSYAVTDKRDPPLF